MIDKYLLLSTLQLIKRNFKESLGFSEDKKVIDGMCHIFNAFSNTLEKEILSGRYDIKESKSDGGAS